MGEGELLQECYAPVKNFPRAGKLERSQAGPACPMPYMTLTSTFTSL